MHCKQQSSYQCTAHLLDQKLRKNRDKNTSYSVKDDVDPVKGRHIQTDAVVRHAEGQDSDGAVTMMSLVACRMVE
jgi:hypothetical protein